jgi:hypothetical protein
MLLQGTSSNEEDKTNKGLPVTRIPVRISKVFSDRVIIDKTPLAEDRTGTDRETRRIKLASHSTGIVLFRNTDYFNFILMSQLI